MSLRGGGRELCAPGKVEKPASFPFLQGAVLEYIPFFLMLLEFCFFHH